VAAAAAIDADALLAADRSAAPLVQDLAVHMVGVAAFEHLLDAGAPAPVALAGHDAGGITAAVVGGALRAADGAALLAERSRAVGDAARADAGRGGTLAVHGLSDRDEIRLVAGLPPDVVVAEDNAPGELVLAGPARQLAAAATRAASLGARVEDPGAEGAEHSPSMTPVMVRIAAALTRMPVTDPRVQLLDGADGHAVTTAAGVVRSLSEGALAPVHWRAVQGQLRHLDLRAVVELGPGTLHDFAAVTLPDVVALHAARPDDVTALARHLSAA
jgi:[acyl-carrier-protein] S-malonyltransferase